MYRLRLVTLALVSVLLTSGVFPLVAQDKSSDDVDRMLEGLKLKRSDVVESCLENCEKQKSPKITGGGGIVDKVQPQYPPIARAAHASGAVVVLIVINEKGKVIAARSLRGHPLLQASAVAAARESTFKPYLVDDVPVKVMGTLLYSFVPD
jgi:TonB family protein